MKSSFFLTKIAKYNIIVGNMGMGHVKINEIRNGNMNKVYLLDTEKEKYIIRTSDFDNNFECKVLKLLLKYKYKCPSIVTNFELDGKYIIIYRYLEGDNPAIFDDHFFIKLAQLLKQLHSFNYYFEDGDYLANEESQDKLLNYYARALKSRYLFKDRKMITELYESISKLDFDMFDKCIIHSDIKKENMIQNNGDLFLIDFGNCYVGTRLIDVIRVIMWFFIKDGYYDYNMIKLFANEYFNKKPITDLEKSCFDDLMIYCILYNLLKDISLYEDNILTKDYIENNSIKWLKSLKERDKILKIGELIRNA